MHFFAFIWIFYLTFSDVDYFAIVILKVSSFFFVNNLLCRLFRFFGCKQHLSKKKSFCLSHQLFLFKIVRFINCGAESFQHIYTIYYQIQIKKFLNFWFSKFVYKPSLTFGVVSFLSPDHIFFILSRFSSLQPKSFKKEFVES